MEKPILFLGQCKQGSNSILNALLEHKEVRAGRAIRAMVQSHFYRTPYFANWDGIDTIGAKYLADKSIINPALYDYHVGKWKNYHHRMVYIVRNIYKVLRSQFLVVLAGEASYQHCIPKGAKVWPNAEDMTEADVLEILAYNEQKFTHFQNLTNLPGDVFKQGRNLYLCTFESFVTDSEKAFAGLESFLDLNLGINALPRDNETLSDWYFGDEALLKRNAAVFDKYSDLIYSKYINRLEFERLSEMFGVDLISLYGVK